MSGNQVWWGWVCKPADSRLGLSYSSPAPNFSSPGLLGLQDRPQDPLPRWEFGLPLEDNYRDSHPNSLTHLLKPPNSNLPGPPLPGEGGHNNVISCPETTHQGPTPPAALIGPGYSPPFWGVEGGLGRKVLGVLGKGRWGSAGTDSGFPPRSTCGSTFCERGDLVAGAGPARAGPHPFPPR